MTTYVLFIVSGEIKLPQKRSLGLQWYHAVTIAKEIYESRESANMLRYAYSDSLVRFVERRVVFSFFTLKCVWSVKTLRFYGLVSLYGEDAAMKTDLISGRPVSSCSNKQAHVSF